MSAPKTNIPKQTRRHRPALIGIAAAVAFAALALFLYLNVIADPDTAPFGAEPLVTTDEEVIEGQ